jgi:hypothetical protein
VVIAAADGQRIHGESIDAAARIVDADARVRARRSLDASRKTAFPKFVMALIAAGLTTAI